MCALLHCVHRHTLQQEGIMEPVGFWYNPNIHPMKERKNARIRSLSTQKALILKLRLRTSTPVQVHRKLFIPIWDQPLCDPLCATL